MRLGQYYLDFAHNVEDGYTQAWFYADTKQEPIAEVMSVVHYKDRFSRKGWRRACLAKLLSPLYGTFAGDDLREERAQLWNEYWRVMPQDKRD